MLLFAKHGGQLCNRLWAIWPAYAFAREHKTKLHILFAEESYVNLFPNARKDKHIKFWFTSKKWQRKRFVDMVVSFLEKREINGELRERIYHKIGLSSIHGWNHHNDLSFTDNLKFKQSFLKTFSFSDEVLAHVARDFGEFEGKTIGLHVRRGDYRQWKDGRYCYDDDIWHRIMLSVKAQLKGSGIKCRFLVCSNEPFTFSDSNLEIFQISNSDGITDLCALSECDYIIGPPSTYSQWASFSDAPLKLFLPSDECIDLSSFSPVIRIDVLKNGIRLMYNQTLKCFDMK